MAGSKIKEQHACLYYRRTLQKSSSEVLLYYRFGPSLYSSHFGYKIPNLLSDLMILFVLQIFLLASFSFLL
jgi:hypothetical protein